MALTQISWRTQPIHSLLRNKIFLGVAILLILLLCLRLALPTLVENYVNRQLQNLNAYTGHVDDIHIALWRGAYEIENIVIEKKTAKRNEPFLNADRLELAIQWRALLHGSLVGKAHFYHAQLNFIQSEDSSQRQLGNENNWNDALQKLFPFTFNEITGDNCVVRFRAPGIERQQALVLHDIHFSLRNLTNALPADDQRAFASFDLQGRALGQGALRIDGKLNPAVAAPTFEVAAELKEVSLPELNPWLDTYAGVNAESGLFSVFTEFAAAEGKFKGYVKPIAKEIKVVTPPEKKGNILNRAWTGVVQLAATLFKNHPHDQLATQIPFSGSIDNPDADVWMTIVNILRNAFVNAFSNSLERSVNLKDVKSDNEQINVETLDQKIDKK